MYKFAIYTLDTRAVHYTTFPCNFPSSPLPPLKTKDRSVDSRLRLGPRHNDHGIVVLSTMMMSSNDLLNEFIMEVLCKQAFAHFVALWIQFKTNVYVVYKRFRHAPAVETTYHVRPNHTIFCLLISIRSSWSHCGWWACFSLQKRI